MRRFLSLMICVVLLLGVVGCGRQDDADVDTDTGSDSESVTQTETEAPISYEDIPREKVLTYQEVHVSFGEDMRLIRIFLPKTWTLEREVGKGYRLLRNDRQIGTLYSGDMPASELGETVKEQTTTFKNGSMRYTVERLKEGEGAVSSPFFDAIYRP